MDLSMRYGVHVHRDENDEGFVAVCPAFPSLSAYGETREEAVHELQVVLEGAVATYQEEGWPLPDPDEPRERSLPSGEFRVRLPRTLHRRLAQRAEEEGVSQNALVVAYVADGLGREDMLRLVRQALAGELSAV